MTAKAERAVKAEKRRITRDLRELRKECKSLITGRWLHDAGWWGMPYCQRPCGIEDCEGCMTRGWLQEKAEPLTHRIEELKQELQRISAVAAPLRRATVTTGGGEQLVMFV